MAHFQRDYRRKKERYQRGIQQDINSNLDHNSHQSVCSNNGNLSENLSARTPIIKSENIGKLVEGIDRKNAESKMLKEKANSRAIDNRRSVQLNLMRLQDKQFQLNQSIYNITVGQIIDRQAYLKNLNNEISQLKGKIRVLESEDNEQKLYKTMQVEEKQKASKSIDPVLQKNRTIQERKSQCGRIYTRIKTPSSGRSVVFGVKDPETSSYYKWRAKVDQNDFYQEERSNAVRLTQNTSQGKRKQSEISKPIANYRAKQKKLSKGVMSQIQCQTEDLKQLQEAQFKKSNKDRKKSEQNPQKVQKQAQKQKQQEKVLLQPYSGVVFIRQPVPEWQITKIEDDFRQKITKKLQIPQSFPIQSPEIGQKFQYYEQLGRKIFELFGLKLDRQQKKIITRKFKNGLYYQLDAGKNIIWYYSGTFYFGDWDVDLPTETQKNGFGFEYVPNKYIYLGYFKDGMRHGQGTIKIFSTKIDNAQDFMAYDGEWANGKPNGYGRHIDQKNTKYIGEFKMGEKTGKATILAKDGLYYQGEVRKNLKHGYGFQKLVNGDTYTGQFQDGKFTGMGTYKWKNGSVFQGQFVKGKRQGKGRWKGHNGDLFQGQYFQDIKNGWGKFTWANGQIYQGEFRNDIRHGQGTYRHPNGKVGKFMWIDGQIDHRIYSKEEQQYRCRKLKQAEVEQIEETPEQIE